MLCLDLNLERTGFLSTIYIMDFLALFPFFISVSFFFNYMKFIVKLVSILISVF